MFLIRVLPILLPIFAMPCLISIVTVATAYPCSRPIASVAEQESQIRKMLFTPFPSFFHSFLRFKRAGETVKCNIIYDVFGPPKFTKSYNQTFLLLPLALNKMTFPNFEVYQIVAFVLAGEKYLTYACQLILWYLTLW